MSSLFEIYAILSACRVLRTLQTLWPEVWIGQHQMLLCKMVLIGWKNSRDPCWGLNISFHQSAFSGQEHVLLCARRLIPTSVHFRTAFFSILLVWVGFRNPNNCIACIEYVIMLSVSRLMSFFFKYSSTFFFGRGGQNQILLRLLWRSFFFLTSEPAISCSCFSLTSNPSLQWVTTKFLTFQEEFIATRWCQLTKCTCSDLVMPCLKPCLVLH